MKEIEMVRANKKVIVFVHCKAIYLNIEEAKLLVLDLAKQIEEIGDTHE